MTKFPFRKYMSLMSNVSHTLCWLVNATEMKSPDNTCWLVSITLAQNSSLFWIKRREPKTATSFILPLTQSAFQLPLSRKDLLKWKAQSQRS